MTRWPITRAHIARHPIGLLALAVLCLHLWGLSESPAWFSANPNTAHSTQAFVTRRIESSPRAPQKPSPPLPPAQSAEPPTHTPHEKDTLENGTPSPPAPFDFEALQPNVTSPVSLPERAASAVDLPPFQRTDTEGLNQPTHTSAPASAVMSYAVQGFAKGFNYHASSRLFWENTQSHYQARLEVSAFLLGTRTQTSTGALGNEGLLPTRFSDKSRSELAAHFQRDKGIISFSANSPDVPLLKGAQDRLSVVLQLSTLLAGDPTRYPVGTMLSFQTVSQREAEVWQFKVDKEETLQLPYGEVPSIKLLRNPRRDFDQRIELWLAPALSYLPVRLRITHANGDVVDQMLRSVEKPAN